ncbi:MAG: DUF58 domain-containing protein [Planctomycetota bacterium JB042]
MSRGPLPFDELFDPAFLEAVERLRIVARRVPRGGRPAEQRSDDRGAGIEFKDYRPYVPGDDLRGVDWNIYRRLGRVFLRQFEELEDLPVHLLTDVSASLWLEDPPRARAGLRCALALAAIALGQHDSVGLFPFSDDLTVAERPRSGKGRWMRFAHALAALSPGGPTDFGRSLRRFEGMRLRSGLVVLISDFFDPAGVPAIAAAAKRLRHRLLFVQLVRTGDAAPTVDGDVRLVDCETGATEDVSVTAAVRQRYRDAYRRFEDGLSGLARSRGAGLLRLDADGDVAAQLARLFEAGALAV